MAFISVNFQRVGQSSVHQRSGLSHGFDVMIMSDNSHVAKT